MSSRQFTNDAGQILLVEFDKTGGSSAVISLPWLSEPGEPMEIEVLEVTALHGGQKRSLSPDEESRFCEEVNCDPEEWDDGDDYYLDEY